jgi:hypothetical protein
MHHTEIRLTTPEQIPVSRGQLTVMSGEDLVIIRDSGQLYPIKQPVFAATDEAAAPGRFRKPTRSQLVQMPPGVEATRGSRKGKIEVRHPDYVISGADNEIYANAATWVEKNLEFFS